MASTITYRDMHSLIGNLSLHQLDDPVRVLDENTGDIITIAKVQFPQEDLFVSNDTDPVFLVKA